MKTDFAGESECVRLYTTQRGHVKTCIGVVAFYTVRYANCNMFT